MKFLKRFLLILTLSTVVGCGGSGGTDLGSAENVLPSRSETPNIEGVDARTHEIALSDNDAEVDQIPDSREYAIVLDLLANRDTDNDSDMDVNNNFEPMNSYTIYLSGPSYHPEERESMRFLGEYLRESGYALFSSSEHGFQSLIMKTFTSNEYQTEEIRLSYKKYCLLSFALEYFKIISADACIGFLNGRVPDESTVIKMGIAFSMGIPVIHYKYDPRILFPNGVNTMISGLTENFKHIKDIRALPETIEGKIINNMKNDIQDIKQRLSPYNLTLFHLGGELDEYFKQKDMEYPGKMTRNDLNEMIDAFENNSTFLDLCQSFTQPTNSSQQDDRVANPSGKITGKVYCSGALFCPAEVREMKHISDVLEDYGLSTFLPQRDGGEAFIMEAIDSPLAGSLISKPAESLLNTVLFSLDIYEVLKCDFFVINLNGRVPDDGAMAELGVAFGAGKPIVFFKNDIRALYGNNNHPTLQAVGYLFNTIDNYETIPAALADTSKFLNTFGENHYSENLPEHIVKINEIGKTWQQILKCFKAPENKMEHWNQL